MGFFEWLKRKPVHLKPTPPVHRPLPPTPPPSSTDVGPALLAGYNALRAVQGQPALAWSPKLGADAKTHASLMALLRNMSHGLPGEPNLGQRLTALGYHWSWAAENIATGYPDVVSVMQGWKTSPGHLANILGPSTEMGGAMAIGSDGVPYWSVTMGRPGVSAQYARTIKERSVPMVERGQDGTTSSMRMMYLSESSPYDANKGDHENQ